jgi:hypothetical protein
MQEIINYTQLQIFLDQIIKNKVGELLEVQEEDEGEQDHLCMQELVILLAQEVVLLVI